MSDLAVIDPASALERAADPGEFVVMCLERGKTWLAEALAHGDLDAIVNAKGWAETLRVATVQKQLGLDAELSASELVRRAERALGLGIRAGQAAGDVRVKGETTLGQEVAKESPSDYFSNKAERQDAYFVTDQADDEQFEQAIAEAKAEKNLSRANVIRKIKGETAPAIPGDPRRTPVGERVAKAREMAATGHSSRQIAAALGYSEASASLREFLTRHGIEVPADAVVSKTRRIDSNRVVEETANSLEGLCIGIGLVDFDALDPAHIEEWVASLSASIRKLASFNRQLKETTR